MFKQVCNDHKQAIIGVADEIPICSSCDTEKYWVLQSSQQKTLELFQTEYQNHYKQKLPILKMKRKLQILIQTFQVFENHFINQLDCLISMHLNKIFNSLLAGQIIKNIDMIQGVLEKLQHLVNYPKQDKIIEVCVPKDSKLMELETKLNKQHPIHQENKHQVKVEVKEHNKENLKDKIEQQKEQLEEAQDQHNFSLGIFGYQEEDIVEKLKGAQFFNIYMSENNFYDTIQTDYIEKTLFNDIMTRKLCIELAPKELLQMNRKINYFVIRIDNEFIVKGYAYKNMLNGRGMVYSTWYYENGYYVDGLLVWGQIALIQNNIIQRFDIVNYDSVKVVKQIAGYSLLWNKYHQMMFTNN